MEELLEDLTKSLSLLNEIDNENSQVISRETEMECIRNFIKSNLSQKSTEKPLESKRKSLYICGNPGTGKSLTVNSILSELPRTCKPIYINCMQFEEPSKIYVEIYRRLNNLKSTTKNDKDSLAYIEENISKNDRMVCLVLDEVDHLATRFCQILYNIFEWPYAENSKFFIIGIANGLDLVQKFLTKLTKLGREPQLLKFKPYSEQQIINVLRDRVFQCRTIRYRYIFPAEAYEICAKHVSNNKGDMRRALDIFRRVVNMKQEEYIDNGGYPEEDDDMDEDMEDYNVEDFDEENEDPSQYIFTIDDLLNVISIYFDNQIHQLIKSLPLHSQLILISISQSQSLQLNFSNLFKIYEKNCKFIQCTPLTKEVFFDSLSGIICTGLINMVDHKIESNRKITKLYSNVDLKISLDGVRIFQSLIEDISNNEEGDN